VAGETARGAGLIRAVRNKAREMQAEDLERFANLITVVVLSDAGRIEEGELILPKVFNVSEDLLDDYILWPGNGKRAFFAYRRGDYQEAFKYLSQAWGAFQSPGHPASPGTGQY
jgi:hypothetical protein